MTAPTHIVFGLLSASTVFSVASTSLEKDLPAVGFTILGSLLPDIDSPNSSVGRALPFISAPIERRWGHRTITHSFLALLGLAMLVTPLLFFRMSFFSAVLIGYFSHLIADCATKSGTPLFYPNRAVCVFPENDRYRVLTGSLFGEGIVLIVLLILLAMSMPISRMGGFWRAMRYVMATQKAAYSDYREATTETVLTFEGKWRESRQPVNGEALILDATPGKFLIGFEGRTLAYGEQGDILPDKSRVRETARPIRVEKLEIHKQRLVEILDRIPEGRFISGRLESGAVFNPGLAEPLPATQHEPIQMSPKALKLVFAPRSDLLRLSPAKAVDPDRVSALKRQVRELRAELSRMQIQQPPVHYLKLREARRNLEAKQKELEKLSDPTVRFDGILSLRMPGKEE